MLGFGQAIGIDLGTATVLVHVKGKGIVLREPSVVAIDRNTGEAVSVGEEARRMLGRTPGNIVAIRPLKDGVISDYAVTEKMLKYFIKKVCGKFIFAPTIMVCVPSGVTEVEKKAVVDAATQAGAKKVLVSAPCKGNVKTVVYGVNDNIIESTDTLLSAASCTTNCLAPVLKVLNDSFGIEKVL